METLIYAATIALIFVGLFLIFHKQQGLQALLCELQTVLKEGPLQNNTLIETLTLQTNSLRESFTKQLGNHHSTLQTLQHGLQQAILQQLAEMRIQLQTGLSEHQIKSLNTLQTSLQQGMQDAREQIHLSLQQHSHQISERVDKLTQNTDKRLQDITAQVERRLTDGFEKTTATFADVVKRLALIDEAQKKITELSSNVVSLQQVLSDKTARGTFGEVQLNALIRNVLPETHFALQHTLKNNKRVDCMLFLPEPTGNITIDAKFPLESYRAMSAAEAVNPLVKRQAEQQFKQDIRRHIQDIAEKYIIPGETADGAMMFIPAEAVFAEIHARHSDLVDLAQRARVWLVSPTTMMAILTTARAVLKDADTRKQIHIIQEHLVGLSKDFSRFQNRMDNLSRHIGQAHDDIEQVHTSAKKITQRFQQIEQVELQEKIPELLVADESTD
ncbi:MAG: rmuC [Gammaproteobacteria bacterium]|jgi:DNA recombination protein RmuC|nr:rmuC [Gammaproteobacteria bacterium]